MFGYYLNQLCIENCPNTEEALYKMWWMTASRNDQIYIKDKNIFLCSAVWPAGGGAVAQSFWGWITVVLSLLKKLFTRKQWEWVVWWFCWQREATSPHLPAHEDVSQSAGQTSINQPGAQTHGTASQDQGQHRQGTDGWEPQQWWEPSSQTGMYSTWMNNTHVVSCKYVDNGVDNNQHFLYYQNFRTVTCLQPFPCFLSTLVWSTCSENILYSNKVTMNLPL